ncbi:ABC transporter permease [Psychromicrobium xiongbiense]|uniref:ABC transporter permease n=1 Tax=Psychromicrobium xiongbiense TaxID=3051184 RepID=UPI0025565364|nr:ABC transporter permease [Psychromicrobium sp. YIM S02556]
MTFLKKPGLILSALIVLLALLAVALPALLSPQDPFASIAREKLLPPSPQHWFGTDHLGRDLYARVIYGARLSLAAAAVAVVIGVLVGALVGAVSGAIGGALDFVLMRIVDVLVAVPGILLALIVVASLGFGPWSMALGVGLGAAGSFARVMRAQVLKVRQEEYVEAATVMGIRRPVVLLQHVLPNAARPVISMAALELGTAILSVSALSFLGFGAQPPEPEWGSLVAAGRDYVATSLWLSLLPGVCVVIVVLAVNRLARQLGADR